MRSDKEQLDIILERKAVAEAARARRKKTAASILLPVLVIAVITACAVFAIGDGDSEKDTRSGVVGNVMDNDIVLTDDSDCFLNSTWPPCSTEQTDSNQAWESSEYGSTVTLEPSFSDNEISDEVIDTTFAVLNNLVATGNYEYYKQNVIDAAYKLGYTPASNMGICMYLTTNKDWVVLNFAGSAGGNHTDWPVEESGIGTVLLLPEGNDINSFISLITDKYGEDGVKRFRCDKWKRLKKNQYYCSFSIEEIKALASAGIKCLYVANGEGNVNDINYNTADGLKAFCEYYGDLFSWSVPEDGRVHESFNIEKD